MFAFLNAYVLGANTLGLLVALSGFNGLIISIAVLGIFFVHSSEFGKTTSLR
jgi:hypothetical protein